MKFVGEVLGNVNGIQNYYIAGILIFIALFIIILFRTFRIPKEDLIEFKNSILDSNDEVLVNNDLKQ